MGVAGATPWAGVSARDVEVDAILAAFGIALAGTAAYAALVAEVTYKWVIRKLSEA